MGQNVVLFGPSWFLLYAKHQDAGQGKEDRKEVQR